MIILTGYHRTGTSAIYYDLCSRIRSMNFIPPARPLAKMISIFREDMEDDYSFYPQISAAKNHQSNLIKQFINDVYGRDDQVFLKSTDFIFNISYLLSILPKLRVVVVIRDPLPTISSLYNTRKIGDETFNDGTAMALDIAGEYCDVYNALITMAESKQERIFWVSYEEYCKSPTAYSKPLTNFCDLKFSSNVAIDECEQFYLKYKSYASLMRRHGYWARFITDYTGKPITSKPSNRGASELYSFDHSEILNFLSTNIDPKLIQNGLIGLE